ncbi:hypothetical protein GCM10027162_56240 [Streptomyces incanus]
MVSSSIPCTGADSRLRHIVAPGEKAKTSKGFSTSPHVLFAELMDFFLGRPLAGRLAGAEAPVCSCAACEGLWALDAFAGNEGERQARAAAHNVAVLMEWLRTLAAVACSGSALSPRRMPIGTVPGAVQASSSVVPPLGD